MKKRDWNRIEDALRDAAPHGHPDFIPNMVEAIRLHSDKNWDYAGDGDPLGNFNRVAAMCKPLFRSTYASQEEAIPLHVLLLYMAKQFDAIIDSVGHGREMKVEALSGKLIDISIYAQLGRIMLEEE